MSYIKIDKTKCKSCYLCIDVCPQKCIQKSSEIGKTGECVAEFLPDNNCLGCKQCAIVCPEVAIVEVYKE